MGVQIEDKKKNCNTQSLKTNRHTKLKQIKYNEIFRWLFLIGVILNILVLAGTIIMQQRQEQLMNFITQDEYEYERQQDYLYFTQQTTFQRIMQDQNCNLFKQIKQYIQPINSLDEMCQTIYKNI